jgi:hypothetical protein
MIAGALDSVGWAVSIAPGDEEDPTWGVLAEQENVVLTAHLVRTTRELFERMAALLPGAEYDGWEASIDFDEVFDTLATATEAADE